MPRFPGLSPTGRRVRTPTTDFIELEDSDGKLLIAVAFREAYRDAPILDKGIETIKPFLEMPMIPGLGELKVTLLAPGRTFIPAGTPARFGSSTVVLTTQSVRKRLLN